VERDDSTSKSDVLLTERSGNVLVLTLNRPEARNAPNPELKDQLIDAIHGADDDPDVRVVVLTGNGPVFCAGMDLKAFAAGADFGGLSQFYSEGFGKPVIAALNGTALAGGFELGLTGDPITADRAAEIGLVNKVVPAGEVRPEAIKLAERIAANAPLSVAVTKKLMRERRWAEPADIDTVFRSADAMEGARAFAERRPPVWTGK
jgi:enoyl-CoA hydratase